MSDKPRIYGFCDAGCKWEVMHSDDVKQLVANSATYIPLTADASGAVSVGLDTLVKVTKASKKAIGATIVIKSKYTDTTGVTIEEESDITSPTTNAMDEYSKYLRFELLAVEDVENDDGSYSKQIKCRIDGERLATKNTGTHSTVRDYTDIRLVITGASEVMEVNEDATVTLVTEGGGECGVVTQNITEDTTGGVNMNFTMPKEDWSVAYVTVTQSGIGNCSLFEAKNFYNSITFDIRGFFDGTRSFVFERHIFDNGVEATTVRWKNEPNGETYEDTLSDTENGYIWNAGNPAGAPVSVSIVVKCI